MSSTARVVAVSLAQVPRTSIWQHATKTVGETVRGPAHRDRGGTDSPGGTTRPGGRADTVGACRRPVGGHLRGAVRRAAAHVVDAVAAGGPCSLLYAPQMRTEVAVGASGTVAAAPPWVDWVRWALAVAVAVPVLVRRRWPLAALAVALAAARSAPTCCSTCAGRTWPWPSCCSPWRSPPPPVPRPSRVSSARWAAWAPG